MATADFHTAAEYAERSECALQSARDAEHQGNTDHGMLYRIEAVCCYRLEQKALRGDLA